jgi:hypothetical protein
MGKRLKQATKWAQGYVTEQAERAGVECSLDPIAFWCRFCRITLEPVVHA